MSTNSMFNKNEIESINSYGPFNHSHWDGRGVSITNEEGLEGRADLLVKKIRENIKKNFSTTQIKKMSIVDVGCYDGWILHQLSDLPFKKMVGIEPRKKNILKGQKIRRALGIFTRVKFQEGSLETLGKEKFDIVLCIGVFPHIESIATAFHALNKICIKMLVIDTVCFPSLYISENFKKDIEMKDVIYQFKEKMCGVTAQKYESSYYDGSTFETSIVSIASIETLLMHFDVLGYRPIRILAGPEDYAKALKKNKRPFREVLISGIKQEIKNEHAVVLDYAKRYELGIIKTIMPTEVIWPLYEHYVLGKKKLALTTVLKKIFRYIDFAEGTPNLFFKYSNDYEVEIIKNIKFNFYDKISFEWGKILLSEGKYSEAILVLQAITQKLNSDWRSVYRSFYLLAMIFRSLGELKKSARYIQLCSDCHTNFPLVRNGKLL